MLGAAGWCRGQKEVQTPREGTGIKTKGLVQPRLYGRRLYQLKHLYRHVAWDACSRLRTFATLCRQQQWKL